MARRKTSGKQSSFRAENLPSRQPPAGGVLDRLAPEEANTVLRLLLEKHPELHPEAEQIATDLMSSPSVEDIAADVFERVTGVGMDDLNERAGAHSWGYVEPSEAAIELLGESVEDVIEDMKRKVELGLAPAAEAICLGIVEGLYRARNVQSDGALGWAPDFLAEEAGYAVEELIRSCPAAAGQATLQRLIETLISRVPEWEDLFRRIAERGVEK